MENWSCYTDYLLNSLCLSIISLTNKKLIMISFSCIDFAIDFKGISCVNIVQIQRYRSRCKIMKAMGA